MKKTNNKGFSLVELIVVIAIMAVLMVVIAPQLLRYVDKARQQRDDSAAAEFLHAVEIALATEDIYNDTTDGDEVAAPDAAIFTTTNTGSKKLLAELNLVFPEGQFDYSSNAYNGKTYTVKITKDANGTKVAGSWN